MHSSITMTTGFATTLEEDEAMVQALLSDPSRDLRRLAVITYRMERKKIIGCTRGLLERYLEIEPKENYKVNAN
jgi:hypothetical protein